MTGFSTVPNPPRKRNRIERETKGRSHLLLLRLVLLVATATVPAIADALRCSAEPSEAKKQSLGNYVRKKFNIPESVILDVAKEDIVKGTCYREITFRGKGLMRTWNLTLYLSPDGRFLTSELLDTEADPVEEKRRKNKAIMSGLIQGSVPVLGSEDAPVIIVEFSDFQCPSCRRFAQILDQVFPLEKDRVRVVFRHLPLSVHPWARLAAEGAACAQLQSNDAFWSIHDQLFQNQSAIGQDNAKQRLLEYAEASNKLDLTVFRSCLDNQLSLGLVFRDMNLASGNEVNETPTLFINGHRVSGVRDAARLRELIAEAQKETPENTY